MEKVDGRHDKNDEDTDGLRIGGHQWVEANDLVKWPHCAVCGIIRRHDDKNNPCKGAAKIALRNYYTEGGAQSPSTPATGETPRTNALQKRVCDKTDELQCSGRHDEASSEARLQECLQEAYDHARQLEGGVYAAGCTINDQLEVRNERAEKAERELAHATEHYRYTKEDIAAAISSTQSPSTYDVVADAVQEIADAAEEAFKKAGLAHPGEWDGDNIVEDVKRGICSAIERLATDQARLREVEHMAWHLMEASEENATTGEFTINPNREDVLELATLLPEAHPEPCAPSATPAPEQMLWLWKNFVDGKPEYWAFDNPYPTFGGGDPQTLGSPAGYAIFKESTLSPNHKDWTDAEILAEIKRAKANPKSEPSAACVIAPPSQDSQEASRVVKRGHPVHFEAQNIMADELLRLAGASTPTSSDERN